MSDLRLLPSFGFGLNKRREPRPPELCDGLTERVLLRVNCTGGGAWCPGFEPWMTQCIAMAVPLTRTAVRGGDMEG